jgi:hypothetical protein
MSRIFDEDLQFACGTRAVHAGQRPDPTSGAIMTPIFQTSTYAQSALGVNTGYEYARGKNPTREALERNIATLEGGTHGFAFASGMGTIDSIMKLFKSGDRILCADNMYGGTPRLFDRILVNMGLQFTYVDTRSPARGRRDDPGREGGRRRDADQPAHVDHRLAPSVRSPGGTGRCSSLDNTFATPSSSVRWSTRHIVFPPPPRYLNGHSDMVGGCAVVNDDDLATRLQFILNAAGAASRTLRQPGSSCAGPRRCTCGWPPTTPMDGAHRRLAGPAWATSASSTRGSPRTRTTRWPRARCRALAG